VGRTGVPTAALERIVLGEGVLGPRFVGEIVDGISGEIRSEIRSEIGSAISGGISGELGREISSELIVDRFGGGRTLHPMRL
jgi:hypothetical protein